MPSIMRAQQRTPRVVVTTPARLAGPDDRFARMTARLEGVQPLLRQVQAVLQEGQTDTEQQVQRRDHTCCSGCKQTLGCHRIALNLTGGQGAQPSSQRRRQRAVDGVKSLAQQLAGLNTDIEALSSPTAGAAPPAPAELSSRSSRITAMPARPVRGGSQPYQAQVCHAVQSCWRKAKHCKTMDSD